MSQKSTHVLFYSFQIFHQQTER